MDFLDAYHLIRNSPTKSILSNSQHSSPQRTVCLDHPLSQQQNDSPNKSQTYHTPPNRKITDSPTHQLIQIQQSNIDNGIVTLQAPVNLYPVVNRFPYHYSTPTQSPQAFFVKNDNNCEYYLTSSAQPLYVAQSNVCRPTGSPQHHQPQQMAPPPPPPQQQPAFQLIHLQTNPNQANLLNQNQCNSNNQQAMHIKQLHTATVHGKLVRKKRLFISPHKRLSHLKINLELFKNPFVS